MTDLQAFRSDVRAWLEANCPPEMRQPLRGEEDICWGGRNFSFASDAQRVWMQRMAERGWTVPEVLLSGNHEQIRRWRRKMALAKTLRNRPDLLAGAALSKDGRQLLDELGVE